MSALVEDQVKNNTIGKRIVYKLATTPSSVKQLDSPEQQEGHSSLSKGMCFLSIKVKK